MGSNTAYAIETLVTLFGILILSFVVLFGAKRLGLGRASGPMQLLGKLPLDGRKSVYLVRVGQKSYALLASETTLTKLDDVDWAEIPAETPNPPLFAQLLAKATSRKKSDDDAH